MNDDIPTLWHYTTSEGLCKIFESQSFFATDIRYLNDAMEFRYSEDVLTEDVLTDENRKSVWAMRKACWHPQSARYPLTAVFCLSTLGDDLSQWRAYAPFGGAAIGFQIDGLKAFVEASDQQLRLEKCIYDRTEQARDLEAAIDRAWKWAIDRPIDLMTPERACQRFMPEFMAKAPTFKHHKFDAESEWRIVASAGNEVLGFHASNGMVKPHIPLKLPFATIRAITVGPSSEKTLSMEAVERLSLHSGLEVQVTPSDVPYRAGW